MLDGRWFAAAPARHYSYSTLISHLTTGRASAARERIPAAACSSLTPTEQPRHHARRLVRRGPRLLLYTPAAVHARRPAAPSRSCVIIITQLSACLPCLLRRIPLRFARHIRPPSVHIANLSVSRATRSGCLLLCTRIPRSPSSIRAIIRRAWTWLVRSVVEV